MKLRITFKDPDALDNALANAAWVQPDGVTADEWDELRDKRRDRLREELTAMFEWGEYVSVEYDTVLKTFTVVRH